MKALSILNCSRRKKSYKNSQSFGIRQFWDGASCHSETIITFMLNIIQRTREATGVYEPIARESKICLPLGWPSDTVPSSRNIHHMRAQRSGSRARALIQAPRRTSFVIDLSFCERFLMRCLLLSSTQALTAATALELVRVFESVTDSGISTC